MSGSIFTGGEKTVEQTFMPIKVNSPYKLKSFFNKTVFFKNKNMSCFYVKINKDGISKIFGFQISLDFVYVKKKP